MQTEAEAFLQRIRAYPDDAAQRLIFADWLDEEGDPRGQFIRVQLALAELAPDEPARKELVRQERELLAAHREEWEAPFRRLRANGFVFHRGFVEELKIGAKEFLRYAPELFAAAPVRHVHLQDISDGLPAVLQSPYLSRLAALTVYAQHTGEPLARAVARSEYLANLKRLTLKRNRLADDAVEHLTRSPHLANLEELDLSENEIGETGGRAIAASPHFGKIRRLELRNNRLGPAGAEALASSDRLASLQRLGLSDNEVGLPRLHSLSRVCTLLGVPVVDLAKNGLSAAGLQAILLRLPGADVGAVRLTDLELGHNGELGDNGCRVLAACPHLTTLTALRLSNCGIGNEGTRVLANSPHLNNVVELDLDNNPIDDAGFRPFLDTPHWRALRKLAPPRAGLTPWMRGLLDQKFNRPRRA